VGSVSVSSWWQTFKSKRHHCSLFRRRLLFSIATPKNHRRWTNMRSVLSPQDRSTSVLQKGISPCSVCCFHSLKLGLALRASRAKTWQEAKRIETTQDHLQITGKTSAEWQRVIRSLPNQEEQAAALAFLMDGGLSFLPPIHYHRFLEDADLNPTDFVATSMPFCPTRASNLV
jgi:hypothetical protein